MLERLEVREMVTIISMTLSQFSYLCTFFNKWQIIAVGKQIPESMIGGRNLERLNDEGWRYKPEENGNKQREEMMEEVSEYYHMAVNLF